MDALHADRPPRLTLGCEECWPLGRLHAHALRTAMAVAQGLMLSGAAGARRAPLVQGEGIGEDERALGCAAAACVKRSS